MEEVRKAMAELIGSVNSRIKSSGSSLALIIFKILSGVFLGLTLSLIGDEIIGYGTFSFTFVIVVMTGVFLRMVKSWRFLPVLIFDLICVLLGLLLRMYILIAPVA